MTRLYIVEQSGLEPGGHYYSYTRCVADGARQLGLEPVVLANKRFRDSAAQGQFEVVPAFTYSWGEAELKGTLEWTEGNIAYEMFEAFRRLPPAADDHVFLHTLGYRELRALLAALTDKLPGDPIPYFHILLRRDPDLLIENYRQYAEHFALLAASPWLQQKIRLYTDTTLLSAAYAEICGTPFLTAPIPFDQSLLRTALAARPQRAKDAPLTIAYLGDAREEKGYQHLPGALSYLWNDYVAAGRVRFVLQSNYNTPGGEPGILAASQVLAGFLSTTLLTEPLQPAEYYEVLAQSDIVLIPYSPQRYRYRSSGVLVEAMAAGKVVVTSAGSWMATQVGQEHAVLFDAPATLGPAIAEAIDRFDELSAGAQARRRATLAQSTGKRLVECLLASAPAAVESRPRHRVLLVMNGDAMVLQNGASRVALAQLQYLTAAGVAVVGLFLTYHSPETSEAFAAWRLALARSIAPFPLEGVFVAGPGRWGAEADQSPAVRDQRQREGAPLRAEFDFVASFEFGGKIMQFLREHPVDVVLLNYITNYPVIEALGLERVPLICEMHDVQSFQRAIYGQRLVDEDDLDEEFKWLARCAALVSLNPRETAIVRARLAGTMIETTGVFLPPSPPVLPSLAGAKDLAEIVSSAGPQLPQFQSEAAHEPGKSGEIERLAEIDTLDLLYVSSAHMANVSGLKWFLSEVYQPFLAHHRVSMIVAGTICRIEGWPRHPRVFFIDQVDDLAPLYAAARVVVLPITEGAGSPVKTFEALAYGRPIVGTSHAFRGIQGAPGEFIIRDEPRDFADAVLDLINSADERREAAQRSYGTAARCNDFARYFSIMDRLFAPILGGKMAPTQAPPPQDPERAFVEWSPPLHALNRAIRSYLDGEAIEGWPLDLLANESPEEVERLLDSVSRSLLVERDAAVLRSEQRLKRYLANPFGSGLRESAVSAVRLAVAERRGAAPEPDETGAALQTVVCGALPLTVAGTAGEAGVRHITLLADGRAARARRLADATRHAGQAQLFQGEIAAVEDEHIGLRALELAAVAADVDGVEPPEIAVLRHSVPLAGGLRLLGHEVVGGGFELRSDGAGADLPPAASGTLSLPRITDGHGFGYVDLCFTGLDAAADGAAISPISILLNRRPVEVELIGGGSMAVVRVPLGEPRDAGDFGIVPLTIVNRGTHAPIRLVAAHSGLLARRDGEAAEIATTLALAGQRGDQSGYPRLAALARDAVALILRGEPPGTATLNALAALAADPGTLHGLVAQEVTRAARRNGSPVDEAAMAQDIAAIIASCLGTGDPSETILCPALPIVVVDDWGLTLPAQTDAALRRRGGSWRLATPQSGRGERLRIQIDATFDIPGHPGVIGFSNFHPAEMADVPFRWTGPRAHSTITVPVALNRPGQLVIELGSTGKNGASGDFSITCNGKPVLHTPETENGRIVRLTAELPASRFPGLSTEIGFSIRECFQQPPDQRVLGVVFLSLSLYLDAPEAMPAAAAREAAGAEGGARAAAGGPQRPQVDGEPGSPSRRAPRRRAAKAPAVRPPA